MSVLPREPGVSDGTGPCFSSPSKRSDGEQSVIEPRMILHLALPAAGGPDLSARRGFRNLQRLDEER